MIQSSAIACGLNPALRVLEYQEYDLYEHGSPQLQLEGDSPDRESSQT